MDQDPTPERRDLLDLPTAEAKALLEALAGLPSPHFRASPEMQDRFEKLLLLATTEEVLRPTRLRQCLLRLLLTVIDCGQASPERHLTPPIRAGVEYIREHLDEPIQIEAPATIAELSVSRFRARFRKELGMSPSEFILRRKIDRAIELMLSTRLSITDVAYRLGFSSSQYFATVFKRFTMQTPRQFQKQWR